MRLTPFFLKKLWEIHDSPLKLIRWPSVPRLAAGPGPAARHDGAAPQGGGGGRGDPAEG